MSDSRKTVADLQQMKARGERIAALTAYDFPTARLLDESGLDIVLVGDSLGMVVLGYPDTTLVTIDEMMHHTRAVARAVQRAFVLADLSIATYDTPDDAVRNAARLIEAGAHGVKLEGGGDHEAQIAALVEADIPVMAHIGMMPQRVRIEGGYRVKGRNHDEAEALMLDAVLVEKAGAFAILLELVQPDVAAKITAAARVPTIGIGSGATCDGQVLVSHDLIGLFPWFTPKFVSRKADVAAEIRRAASEFVSETKAPTSSLRD